MRAGLSAKALGTLSKLVLLTSQYEWDGTFIAYVIRVKLLMGFVWMFLLVLVSGHINSFHVTEKKTFSKDYTHCFREKDCCGC